MKEIKSLVCLEKILEEQKRNLSSCDIGLVKNICADIALNSDNLNDIFSIKIERVNQFHHRIKLYKSDLIEIRANIFFDEIGEIYIHQHGQNFITNCLSGSYDHVIYNIENSNEDYYVYVREKNGNFNKEPTEIRHGKIQIACCQPFEAGQSYFISPRTYHTVHTTSSPLITLLVRDAKDSNDSVEFISQDGIIDFQGSVDKISDQYEVYSFMQDLKQALKNYLKKVQI